MKQISLTKVDVEKTQTGTKVIYYFDAPDEFKSFLRADVPLFAEYPEDLSGCPEGVLAIPFVGIMATASMILSCGIKVSVLDLSFFESLQEVEGVFRKLYRTSGIEISVSAEKLQENTYSSGAAPSVFFTGGVDATSAFISVADQKPHLVNIWGGDIWIEDNASHMALENYLDMFSRENHVDYCFIKTNAREMFEEDKLGLECEKVLGHKNNHGWWASIAHILSMTSACAPWIWINRITSHYIGSSYDGKNDTFDSNNEQLVDAIKFCSCRFHLVDSDIDRNAKVKKIIDYCKANGTSVQLKVCWWRVTGENCCACEKCYRTIMNIIANHADPNQYGFCVNRDTLQQIKTFLSTHTVSAAFWEPIQQTFKEDAGTWIDTELAWILTIKINSVRAKLNRLSQLVRRLIGSSR